MSLTTLNNTVWKFRDTLPQQTYTDDDQYTFYFNVYIRKGSELLKSFIITENTIDWIYFKSGFHYDFGGSYSPAIYYKETGNEYTSVIVGYNQELAVVRHEEGNLVLPEGQQYISGYYHFEDEDSPNATYIGSFGDITFELHKTNLVLEGTSIDDEYGVDNQEFITWFENNVDKVGEVNYLSQINHKGTIYNLKDTEARAGLLTKQNTLIVGENISIVGDVISATGELSSTTYYNNVHRSEDDPTNLTTDIVTIQTSVSGKQDIISDLDTIRSGAELGTTSVQPAAISDMATKTWTNEQGFLKAADISGKADKTYVDTELAKKQDIISAGNGISINNNEVSAVLGDGLEFTDLGSIEVNTEVIQPKLTQGSNININNNVISATGVVTAIKMNGTDKTPTEGLVDLGTIITAHQSLEAYAKTIDVDDKDQAVKDWADGKFITDISGKEDKSNKVTSWQTTVDDIHYPSEKLVKNSLDGKQAVINDLDDIRSGAALGSTALQEHQSLEAYSTTAQMNTAIAAHHDSTKQDTISDLETIRSGAALGATALQSVPNTYRTSANQDAIDDAIRGRVSTIEAKESAWDAKQDAISDLSTIRSNASAGKSASDTIATYGNIVTYNASAFATAAQGAKADTAVQSAAISDMATKTWVGSQGYLTSQSLSNYYTKSEVDTSLSNKQDKNTAVTHTASTAVGSSTQGVYINSSGVATAMAFTVAKSVPSDAVFTDTTYFAGTGLSLSGSTFNANTATSSAFGVIKVGNNLTINNGVLSATDTIYSAGTGLSLSNKTFNLAAATSSTLGGIKVSFNSSTSTLTISL